MADLPASRDLVPSVGSRPAWRRAVGALPALIYAGMVLALFGGLAIDRLPESRLAQVAMVAGGVAVVLLLALWLGRHETTGEAHGPGD